VGIPTGMSRIHLRRLSLALLVAPLSFGLALQGEEVVALTSLDLATLHQGWGQPHADQSVEGNPLSIGGRSFERGIGSHAPGEWWIDLGGGASRFTAWVGVDDEVKQLGSVTFVIYGDGERLYESGVIKGGDAPTFIDVDLTGVQQLLLLMGAGGDGMNYDHANWAEAEITMSTGKPKGTLPPREEPYFLTPKPGPAPKLNNPALFGVRPGHPFLYRIPCTGKRPIDFRVDGLPDGLELDPFEGIIRGNAPEAPGTYTLTLRAKNRRGEAISKFDLVVGDTIALTPPMGWNSWNAYYHRVTGAHLRATADAMVSSGLANFGYMYVNVDDCWMKQHGDEPYRAEDGTLLTNEKFPDIRGTVEHIHDLGLRAGVYIGPGPWTCAGYVASWEHERQDAETFADWGFDFLKYDWCSYTDVATGEGREYYTKPYQLMGDILKSLDRDIVLNMCQYGMDNVWEWGGSVGGNTWRTTGDIGLYGSAAQPGFLIIGPMNAQHWEHAKPGQWNDPDYLMLGAVGEARRMGEAEPTTLTASEQYAYVSMWSLMASPLFVSADLTQLDEFTINVLCNSEIIAINQDRLGKQARVVRQTADELVLAKPLADGSLAVGLFNLAPLPREMSVSMTELGLTGPQRQRDPWRQIDLDEEVEKQVRALVPRHGVHLVRLWPAD
jgi:alpha-galactosidase